MYYLLAFTHLAAAAAGAFGWYRFGPRLAADANVIKTDAKKL